MVQSFILGEVPEVGAGDGCTVVWMYLVPPTVHLKRVEIVNFVYILPQ